MSNFIHYSTIYNEQACPSMCNTVRYNVYKFSIQTNIDYRENIFLFSIHSIVILSMTSRKKIVDQLVGSFRFYFILLFFCDFGLIVIMIMIVINDDDHENGTRLRMHPYDHSHNRHTIFTLLLMMKLFWNTHINEPKRMD